MAILFKGSPLVKGKNFIYENEKIKYISKIYGDLYLFEGDDQEVGIILTESDIQDLKPYKAIDGKIVIEAQEDEGDTFQLVDSFTNTQLGILGDKYTPAMEWKTLANSMQEEVNKLVSLGFSYKKNGIVEANHTPEELYNLIKKYLNEIHTNISETSLPGIYTTLNTFIEFIKNLSKGETNNGDME